MTSVGPGGGSAQDVVEAILGVTTGEPAHRLPLGILAALLVHALALLAAHRPAGDPDEAGRPVPIRPGLEVDLVAPPPVSAPPRPPATAARALATSRHPARSAATEAARAARVIARSPDSSAPLDLTADAVVTGKATAYAGGVTASSGTSHGPVSGNSAGPAAGAATAAPALGRSRPVSLAGESWSCPWPTEADAEQIDEQTVILRVVVSAAGEPRAATVVIDPGHGFGAAARACAMRTHFTPALDAGGAPVAATSPPIRVRFTR